MTIRLQTFGETTLLGPDGSEIAAITNQPKRFALLVYLTTHVGRACHARESIMTMFWPDSTPENARNSLRQAVHFLRHSLGEDVILSRGDGRLSVAANAINADVQRFEALVSAGRWVDALGEYRGDFLEGFAGPVHTGFDEWVDTQRGWLNEIATRCAANAARDAEKEGDFVRAAGWLRRASALAPYDEAIARDLVAALVRTGNRAKAMDVFLRFRRRLDEDLELEPSSETVRAVKDVFSHEGRPLRTGTSGWRDTIRP